MNEQIIGFKMKDLPDQDRPYEKCLKMGPECLTDRELLAVLLRTGLYGEPVLFLAGRVLDDAAKGKLSGICRLSADELMKIRGIGPVKAVLLTCIAEFSRRIRKEEISEKRTFNDPESIAAYYMDDLQKLDVEHLLLLALDTKGHLLGEENISIGTVNQTLASPREIFMQAMGMKAVSVILLHNHPSGDPSPGEDDLYMTRRIWECGRLLGIELLDHIIIGNQTFVSLKTEGLMNWGESD